MSQFVQLNTIDCRYLLDLIGSDLENPTTKRQRSYTVPKLEKILADPKSCKLAYQDVEYLLELIEDDVLEDSDSPGIEQQREMTRSTLLDIQDLQQSRFEETKDIEKQREIRRLKRNPRLSLQGHFEHTSSSS